MNKQRIIAENNETDTISENCNLKNRKSNNLIRDNSNLPKKRKISDDGKFYKVSKCVLKHGNSNCNSKSTQALSPGVQECLEEELKCSICKEMFIHPVTINCSHSFCEYCISQWRNEKNTCPICRQEIINQNVSIVLEKCVDRVIEYAPKKTKKHRKKVLLARETCERILNSPHLNGLNCDDLRNSSEDDGNFELFEILGYIFDNPPETNFPTTYSDFDQCIIN